MFTKEIQERTHWVDPTLKQVKPSLEAPKKKKKIHYKTRPRIKKNKKIKSPSLKEFRVKKKKKSMNPDLSF